MRHSQLVATISAYTADLAKLDRFVQIDADHVGVIHVNLYTSRLTEAPTPKAVLDVYEKHVIGGADNDDDPEAERKPSIEWECIDLSLLSGASLARVAALQSHLDLWNRNEIDDLPATDAPNVVDETPRTRYRGIRRRR